METQQTMDSNEGTHVDIVGRNVGSEFFDQVIGHIEDIVLSEKFQMLHESFLEKHWKTIDNTEENKLEYMEIFEEYNATFESFFMNELDILMPNFDMQRFTNELSIYDGSHDAFGNSGGEIFELLHSFNSFLAFKELILDYRSQKEGRIQHMDFDILITKPLLKDDDEAAAVATP